ncbi:MAG: RNA polymerase sigma factor [Bacteroidales bacterium]
MKFFRGKEEFNPNEPESVIAACKSNNASAQRVLVKLFFGYVKSIALRYSADNTLADEILNESFLKVFNNLHKYDEKQAFKGWLRTIVVNTAIDSYRKNKQTPDYENLEDVQLADLNGDAISSISAEEILALVQQLSPVYRMVFSLYVIDGYSHKEIAEKLGIKEGTSKSNLQDARKRLQSMILKLNPNLYSAYELKTLHKNED